MYVLEAKKEIEKFDQLEAKKMSQNIFTHNFKNYQLNIN